MNSREQLQFSGLIHHVANSLQAGGVSFDGDLRILEQTTIARRMIHPEATIDMALAKGTEGTIGKNWTNLIASSLGENQKTFFGKVPYWGLEGKQLLDIYCVPVSEENGAKVIGGVMVLYDVTGKMNSAHETAHWERLMAIGRVAGKVAHELNNPLDGILRYVNLSLRILEQGQPEKAIEYMQHCRSGLQRMAQIITEMLEFSRSSHFAFENSPLDKLLEDALRSLDGNLKTIEVRVVRPETGPLPHFKSDALFQVFCNLIKNAADAMEGKGTLTITISRTETNWRIDFQDTGPGFEPHLAEDLFKPFFTTKSPGRGTGLGLSICKDILEKFGGQITALNVPEGGACFSVYLPAAASSPSVRS
jgi:signal transduction histidine kinase